MALTSLLVKAIMSPVMSLMFWSFSRLAEAMTMLSGTLAAAVECEDAELRCRVAVEELSPGGQPRRRQALRTAELSLGRNERRELMLRLQGPGQAGRPRCYSLRAARLFTRFAATGRSTLRLPAEGAPPAGAVQLLLSDAPPDRLRRFLRMLRLKLVAAPGPPPTSARTQLLGPRPRDFITISPVQAEEVRRAAATRVLDTTLMKQSMEPRAGAEPSTVRTGKGETPRWPLPVKRLNLPPTKPQLSEEQAAVLRVILKGQSIFFTGSAGTGKSYLLKRILGSLPPTGTVATASTGVAACYIGGTTLHAFAGIGSGQAPLAQCVALAQRPSVRQGWLSCQRLVIDEISMVEAELFDKLEAVARAVRQQNKPFGGIQLIICGDFLQLPPVTKGSQPPQFCFQAKSWRKCVPVTLELTKVWRQADQTFISLLQAVRLGRCSDEVTRQLQATATHKVGRDGIVATRLCTHQDDVALTNERRLQELPGEVHSFEAMDSDPEQARTLDVQCPVSRLLQLKLGAQVMLVKNLAVSRGLVNGARGVVVGFETEGRGLPQVRFLCGVTEVIRADRWTVQATGGQFLTRQQLPLQLAWAISIHKSQGMSLDCVEMSLGRVFASGQAYVALSRARSLQGLRVLDFDPMVVRCDPRVLHFYANLRQGRGLGLESPNDDETASDQENVDPNL
ncbi:ATP-dependent DNA helicase PIF1 isoform X2 [Rousettus aegyptiacus]|uniref:ATP-dependent DNA helicase PIF1 isoform X2 n=2 Tax=Rousettus aegyptiacus TaxID=9407 RepID=UPI00168D1B2D|nr:ATP-dependent DNA helicase PIF1 isoform X2 [Rousettus aegyptiacus]